MRLIIISILFIMNSLSWGVTGVSPITVKNVAALKALAPGQYANVILSGYFNPGDGGGGPVYWNSASTSAPDSCSVYKPTGGGSRGRWVRNISGDLNVKSCGAVGDQTADDFIPVQQALNVSITLSANVLFPKGTYRVTQKLTFPQRNVTIKGEAASGCQIKFDFAAYDDGIEINTIGEGYIKFLDMEIGGMDRHSKVRYAIHCTSIHEFSKINVAIRNAVGMIKIESGYLADLNLRCQASIWDAVNDAGITHAQWLQVYGPNHAPIHLAQMNASNISIRTYRVGSVVDSGVTPFAVLYAVGCAGFNAEALNFEWGLSNYDSIVDAGTYRLRTSSIQYYESVVGNILGTNIETMRTANIIYAKGESKLFISALSDYRTYAEGDRIVNQSAHDQIIESYKAYDVRSAGALFKTTNSSISTENGWVIRSSSIATGQVYRQSVANGGPNNDAGNIYDTYAFTTVEKLGVPDDAPRLYNASRLYTPKVLTGYVVTQGSAAVYTGITPALSAGAYIDVTPGTFMREDGTFVDDKRGTDDFATTGNQVHYRLRPITASKFYRVFVGQAGQCYLVEYGSDPSSDPTGNWLTQFQTDTGLAITSLASNARIALNGFYVPNANNMTLRSNGRPGASTGYYLVGDVWLPTSPTTTSVLGEIVVAGGTSPTWRSLGDPAPAGIPESGVANLVSDLALKAPLASPGFTGSIGLGTAALGNDAVEISSSLTGLTGATQRGLYSQPTFSSGATANGICVQSQLRTQAASFTMALGRGVLISDASKGASSVITSLIGLDVASQTGGATNTAIRTGTGRVDLGDSLVLSGGIMKFNVAGNESTGAGSALLGATNCPAVTVTAVYKWVKMILSDGSVVYMPVWK